MSEKQYNAMGSEIEEGFICKPVEKDPNKPIMQYKAHIFICDAKRCDNGKGKIADELRDIIKSMKLDKGENRIKLTKSMCFGACRYRVTALIYELGANPINNGIWLKHTHKFSVQKWQDILNCIKDGISLKERFAEDIIEMQVFD